MNDWLNYKGSGSVRANANTLEHAASIPNGGKINYIRDNAKEAAAKVRDEKYNYINKELDALYTEAMTQVARQKKVSADLNSFINAARKLKASVVIAQTGLRALQDKGFSIDSKISSFTGSSLQKTALQNKYNSINNKFDSAVPDLTRLPSDVNIDVFNTLIDNINNNSKTNRR